MTRTAALVLATFCFVVPPARAAPQTDLGEAGDAPPCDDCEPGAVAPTPRAPAPAEQNKPPPAAAPASGFALGTRPHRHDAFALAVGLAFGGRSFAFSEPVQPQDPPAYKRDLTPTIAVRAEAFPLALRGAGLLAGIGLTLGYWRTLGAESRVPGATTLADTSGEQIETALLYRWNVFQRPSSLNLRAGVGVGHASFEIDGGYVPNVAYTYLKLALLGIDVPFYTGPRFAVGALGAFDYLVVFSAGDIEGTGTGGYGNADADGLQARFGVYASYRGFFARIEGHYSRFWMAFDGVCWRQRIGACNYAGGALDEYHGVSFLVGYGL